MDLLPAGHRSLDATVGGEHELVAGLTFDEQARKVGADELKKAGIRAPNAEPEPIKSVMIHSDPT